LSGLSVYRIQEDIEEVKSRLEKANVSYGDKTVLVTGGAGFLGSWISDVLVSQNANVICLDNFVSGDRKNIQHLIGLKNFKLIQHDITRPIDFSQHIDIIMHLASRASPLEFTKFPIQILKANTLGVWVALGIARKHDAKFLYTSSSEIYGDPDPENIPTPETYNGNVNPTGLRGCYDEAKRCGEAFVFAYHRQHGLNTRIVRIFNTYGPRLRAGDIYGRSVSRFIEQAVTGKPITIFGDGKQSRSYTYVTDQIDGLLRTGHLDNLSGEIINIGSDKEIQILELAKTIKRILKSPSPLIHLPLPADDPRRRCPDTSKARRLLGWSAQTSLEDGLRKTINWFLEKLKK